MKNGLVSLFLDEIRVLNGKQCKESSAPEIALKLCQRPKMEMGYSILGSSANGVLILLFKYLLYQSYKTMISVHFGSNK